MKNTNMKNALVLLGIIFLTSQGFAQKNNKEKALDSLDIKIGQMIMVGYNGTSVNWQDPIVDEIRKGSVGGVILFEKNISDSNIVVSV